MREPVPLPKKEALLDAMSVTASSKEGSQHLVTRFEDRLIQAKKLEEYSEILGKLKDWAACINYKLSNNAQPWLGQSIETSGFKNMQANMASDAVSALKDMNIGTDKDITLHFAINEKAEFLRGYSSEGKAIDAKSVETLDKLYNAWLAENNTISRGGVLYEANEQGDIKKGDDNQEIRADSDRVRKLITDPDKGLGQYFAKQGGPQLSCQEQQYPAPKADVSARDTAKQAEVPDPTAEGPTTETPTQGHTGMGGR